MFTISQDSNGDFTARIILSTGELAGEGYGPSSESAMFYATKDALGSNVERFRVAGRGHMAILDDADRARLERVAAFYEATPY